MPILPKAMYRLTAIPVRIPTQFFPVMQRQFSTLYGKSELKKAKTILDNKRIIGSISTPDCKFYYRIMVIKTTWYQHKNRCFDQQNQIEDIDLNPHIYGHLIFDFKKIQKYTLEKNPASLWRNSMSAHRRRQTLILTSACLVSLQSPRLSADQAPLLPLSEL